MRLARLTLLSALVSAVLAAPAAAEPRPVVATLTETLATEHFLVHYSGDFTKPDEWIVRQHAGEFAAAAEWAYSSLLAWGYPAPPADLDGLIDVYVYDLDSVYSTRISGLTWPDNDAADTSTAWIEVDKQDVRDPQVAVRHTFAVFGMGMFNPVDRWAEQSAGEWLAFHLQGYPDNAWAEIHEPDASLDCANVLMVGFGCGLEGYESGGFTRWTFWEYLNQRYGRDAVREVWADLQATGPGTPGYDGDDAIAAVLAGKGTSLADFYNDYSLTLLRGDFAAANVAGEPPVVYGTIATPNGDATMVPVRVAVNRLATRFLRFTPSLQSESAHCHPATLTLTVTLPAGVSSRPYFSWPGAGSLTALAVNGTTATAAVPWDTCSADSPGYLSLPNGSQTLDGRLFHVASSLTVDRTRIVSGKPAPPKATLIGQVIAAPTDDPAPDITLYGPATLRVLASARSVPVVVYSTGIGRLHASFGGTPIGSVRLRAGMNRVSFRLPRPAARMMSSRGSRLSLTSVAPGGSWGDGAVQKVAFRKAKAAPKQKRSGR